MKKRQRPNKRYFLQGKNKRNEYYLPAGSGYAADLKAHIERYERTGAHVWRYEKAQEDALVHYERRFPIGRSLAARSFEEATRLEIFSRLEMIY